jgi:hypothetical protein
MQTMERGQDAGVESVPVGESAPRRSKVFLALAVGAAVVVATAGIAYAVGASNSETKTVVRTVPVVRKPASAAPKCIPGAAPGSCNTDEAAELLIPDKPLDAATHGVLAAQLVAARQAALKYPTVADAERAGFILAGGFSPLTGAHYLDLAHVGGTFEAADPGTYIYDGTKPSSPIIGLMFTGSNPLPPDGFAGPNDHWHRHSNTCVQFKPTGISVPFPADSSVTLSQCNAVHGQFMRRTIWMVHAWVVPGWESPSGVFSHDNSNVVCANGRTKTNAAGFCQGN